MKREQRKQWWNRCDNAWQQSFKEAIGIKAEPSNAELKKIINLRVFFAAAAAKKFPVWSHYVA